MNRRQSLKALSTGILSVLVTGSKAFARALGTDDPKMIVYKSPTCGCCKSWIDHVRKNGFVVEAIDVEDVTPYKKQHGVPLDLASCHTGIVDGYGIEGHVPADLIARLLKERPRGAKGLAVPGMPAGSPGMEVGGRKDPYDVVLFNTNGTRRVWARR